MSFCRLILHLTFILSCVGLAAQSRGLMASIVYLTGAESVEEIDSEEIERFERLAAHPVDMNMVAESRLRETGLFSAYQLASLREYRNVHGDIMSMTELSETIEKTKIYKDFYFLLRDLAKCLLIFSSFSANICIDSMGLAHNRESEDTPSCFLRKSQ